MSEVIPNPATKQKLTIHLPEELIQAAKHFATEQKVALSKFVEEALTIHMQNIEVAHEDTWLEMMREDLLGK